MEYYINYLMKYNTYNRQSDRWQLPSPEDIPINESLAFTVNINDDSNTLTVYPRYQALFQKMAPYCDIDMRGEYSKRHKFHYHGWLRIKVLKHILPLYAILNDTQIKNTFTYCLKLLFNGKTEVEDIQNYNTWQKYITKQRSLTKPYLKDMGLNYRTQIDSDHKVGQIYKYITAHDELVSELDD